MCVFHKGLKGEIINAPSGKNDITIMSCNVRIKTKQDKGTLSWNTRAPYILKNISKVQPDIIGFQETKPVQFKYLKKHLKGYGCVCVYRDRKGMNSEACPIFFNKARFVLVKGGAFWLTDTPDVMSKDPGSLHYRICTYVMLQDRIGNQFAIYNAHPDYKGDDLVVKEIKIICNRVSEDNFNGIVIGDLNTGKANPALAPLNDGFDDAMVPFDLAGKSTFNGFNRPTTNAYNDIDHIYLPKGTEILESGIVYDVYDGIFPSDHYPIYTRIKIK